MKENDGAPMTNAQCTLAGASDDENLSICTSIKNDHHLSEFILCTRQSTEKHMHTQHCGENCIETVARQRERLLIDQKSNI